MKIYTLPTTLLAAALACNAADSAKTFPNPEEAIAALVSAVNAKDTNAMRVIFGPASADIQNPDRVQATNEYNNFAAALAQTNHLEYESPTNCTLIIGADLWPFPVPIRKGPQGWYFDTEAGEDELLNRRIGQNELATLKVVRAYVDAQREYAGKDRDGDEVLEYAQKLNSTPGTHDGLYWPPDDDGETSPLGPLVAYAQGEGYNLGEVSDEERPAPFHGYYFKILTRQGKHAPGGKYNYIINGNMIGGFALVAWPADYGQTGIMTFIVNQQGRVYQKDLGSSTAKTARKMKEYDPDSSWQVSPD